MKKLMIFGMFSVVGTASILAADIGAGESRLQTGAATIVLVGSDGIVDAVAQTDEEKKKKKQGSGAGSGSDKRGS